MGLFSMAKARWAAALLSSPRGVGWSHGSRHMPCRAEKTQGRLRFVLCQVRDLALATLALEALLILNEHISVPVKWNMKQLPTIILVDVLMGLSVNVTWMIQYSVIAGLSIITVSSKSKVCFSQYGDVHL